MTTAASLFTTAIREASKGFRYFCPLCNAETWFAFLCADARCEYYGCTEDGCTYQKGWIVR